MQESKAHPYESLRAVVKYTRFRSFVCRVPFQMENPGGYHLSHSTTLVVTTFHTAPPWWLPSFTQHHPGGYHLSHSTTLVVTIFHTAPPWWLPPFTQHHPGGYHLSHSTTLVVTIFHTAPGPQLFPDATASAL